MSALSLLEARALDPARPPRVSFASQPSIAPVGLDLARARSAAAVDEEANATLQIRVPARRRALGKIVVGALGACALILVAAGIARMSHASSAPTAGAVPSAAPAPSATAPQATPRAPAVAPATAPVAAIDLNPSSTGTIRLDAPARPGHVWMDGKKIAGTSLVVSCGTHQIKVGYGRKHSIDVPCGGEIRVAR